MTSARWLAEKLQAGNIVEIEGFPASARLQLLRSSLQLSTRGEEGDYADAGLLVISGGTVISLTMLKFENDPYASFFYGSLECDYLHELLKNDEPVLTATRDGINWSLPFARALKHAVETRIEPLVQVEREHAIQDEQIKLDKQLRRKLDKTIRELNVIASSELSERRAASDGKPEPPPSGLEFAPVRMYVQTGQQVTLTLRAHLSGKIHDGATVFIVSDNPEVDVLTPKVKIETTKEHPHIGIARIQVEGKQVGNEGVVTAYSGDQKAQAVVQVRSRKEDVDDTPARKHHGLFNDIRFDDRMDPRQRVYLDRVNSSVVIATAAPSVKRYLDGQHRLDMVRAAVADQPGLVVDDREIRREGPSYTVLTLRELRDEAPGRPICLLLGMDAFLGLPQWHEWRSVFDLAHVVVAHRPGWTAPDAGTLGELLAQRGTRRVEDLHESVAGRIHVRPVTQLEISSTDLRDLIVAGQDPRYLLPDAVRALIRDTGCYRPTSTR